MSLATDTHKHTQTRLNKKVKKEDLTYKIRGAIFEVNRILGHGFLEKVYENAMMVELQDRGLKAKSQVPISVQYKKREVGEYRRVFCRYCGRR
jgi:hypothetical protein